jgi:dihydrolipoamide dehydrogenase
VSQSFDLIVIGGGPGGYVAAIRAAQLGLKAACVEKRGTLGGTCLNVGCIPSKALLTASHHYDEAGHGLARFGVKVAGVDLDLAGMMAHKDKVVSDNTKGIEFLFKKNKVTYIQGAGRILAAGSVEVALNAGGTETLTAKNILIATGSDVMGLPGLEIDESKILSSTGALALPKVPKSLAVIGAGVIGLELGSVWRRLGAEVTVIEYLDRILPPFDADVAKQAQRLLAKQGLNFKLSRKVTGAKSSKGGVVLTTEAAAGGTPEEITAECVLVAVGRKPYVDGLGLDKAGVELTPKGFVKVGAHFATNVPGIYAIGDVIGGAMLAHKAEDEGMAVAEHLAGKYGHVNYDAIPSVVYTWPEIACVGRNEEELKAAGIAYKTGKFPFTANGRARAMGESDGFVKVLADAKTDQVLGVHILGPNAGDLIAEAVLAMEFKASSEDIARTCHAHPALGEALKEAALAADGRAIHI